MRAAANAGTVAGISSLATISLAEAGALTGGPKLCQLYVHHDEGLNRAMLAAARDAKFDAVALTVDTIVGGNRERCLRSGFTSPPRFDHSGAALIDRSWKMVGVGSLIGADVLASRPRLPGNMYDPINLLNLARLLIEVNGGGDFELNPFPADRKRIDIGDYYGDYRRIRSKLGWRPLVGLRDGLTRTMDYFRDNLEHYT